MRTQKQVDPKLKLILKESYFEITQISHDAHIMVSIHAVVHFRSPRPASATTYKYDFGNDAWLAAGAWRVAAGRTGAGRQVSGDSAHSIGAHVCAAGAGRQDSDIPHSIGAHVCARPRAPSYTPLARRLAGPSRVGRSRSRRVPGHTLTVCSHTSDRQSPIYEKPRGEIFTFGA